MDDPQGRRLRPAPHLPVLAEFWPAAAQDRSRLSSSAGFAAADEVLRSTIDYSKDYYDPGPGRLKVRIRERAFFPNTVRLTPGDHPEMYQRLREAVALLPPGVLDVLGKGPDLCLAIYTVPMTRGDRTGTRRMSVGEGAWMILLGHELEGAPDDAAHGILIHELLHIVIGRSEAFRPYMWARVSREECVARGANDEIEEKVVRLACELGFIRETRAYLAHLERICQDDGGNARFREIVEEYAPRPSP